MDPADIEDGGWVRVAALDGSGRVIRHAGPLVADGTNAALTWEDETATRAARQQPVRLRFELTSATLYAFETGGPG